MLEAMLMLVLYCTAQEKPRAHGERTTHQRATAAKLMLLPQYMGSLITLKGKPVTIWSMKMPK